MANVSVPNTPPAGISPEAARKARESAIKAARREILRYIKDGKPISLKQLSAAEINGATEKTISPINLEITELTEAAKESISSVEKVVFKFLTVDRMAKGERVNYLDLQTIGLIKADSIH